MKKLGIVLAGTVLLAACGQEKAELDTDNQKGSYALGFVSAEQMQQLGVLDKEAFIAGLKDGLQENPQGELTDEEMQAALQAFQQRVMEAQQEKMKEAMEQQQKDMEEAGAKNKEEGAAFLEENAQRDGVTVTESGLQYEVLTAGEEGARSPTLEDTVEVHYHGTLPDGTVFDSSVERGQPASFGLKQIVKGWQEALPMMKEGDKWKIVLPPELGYGEQGAGPGSDIGPNQVLIFEIELLDVKGDE
ncbi:FKBP-type peptidyl-prolyl cis-trans isomerase [Alcanivorax sp.]|uniref:FKBP-type peptidyl-prolyl cis-trans isomerase n=1 Tax=Alcanivorax sp. TaxID=1872427 RepID=UPI00243AE45C|nr:FKBP-type peptidyl-prolyl cis-trans isomerase [Alcanivorax sp.]